jgi:hypothetical protein
MTVFFKLPTKISKTWWRAVCVIGKGERLGCVQNFGVKTAKKHTFAAWSHFHTNCQLKLTNEFK